MALSLHTLSPSRGAKKSKRRLGRGNSSGRGTYSGRGLKGQRARSGGKGGLKLIGMKANIQNLPKLPGFKSAIPKMQVVNVGEIEKAYKKDDIVTAQTLKAKGLISTTSNGVKILSQGEIKKAVTVRVTSASQSAIEKIQKAGGKIYLSPLRTSKKKDATGKAAPEKSKEDTKKPKTKK